MVAIADGGAAGRKRPSEGVCLDEAVEAPARRAVAAAAPTADVFAGLIPTVDLSRPLEEVVEQIRAASESRGPGFFYLENHGVEPAVLQNCIRAAHRFYGNGQDHGEKVKEFHRRHKIGADSRPAVGGKGYIPSGIEGAYAKDGVDVRPEGERASATRNTRESFTFRYPNALEGASDGGARIEEQPYCRGKSVAESYAAWRRQWEQEHNGGDGGEPSEEEMALYHAGSRFFFVDPQPWPVEFQPAVGDYFQAMRTLAGRMYGCFESLLGQRLPAELPMVTFNLAHYAPRKSDKGGGAFGIADHTDWELFTLLYPAYLDPTPEELEAGVAFTGLEVWFQGAWHGVPHKKDTIIVNQGEMLARLSGGRFPAPVHRVGSANARERYSLVSFWGLDFGAPLPDPSGGPGIPAGEHYLLRNQFLELAN